MEQAPTGNVAGANAVDHVVPLTKRDAPPATVGLEVFGLEQHAVEGGGGLSLWRWCGGGKALSGAGRTGRGGGASRPGRRLLSSYRRASRLAARREQARNEQE